MRVGGEEGVPLPDIFEGPVEVVRHFRRRLLREALNSLNVRVPPYGSPRQCRRLVIPTFLQVPLGEVEGGLGLEQN